MRRWAPIAACLAALLFSGDAHAREPRIASDAFYVGARIDPGVALLAGWDLDVYLSRDRSWSLGPGLMLSVLGTGERAGMEQDLMISADILRLKVQVNEAGGEWRPYLMVGGGFSYVQLPEQTEDEVTFAELEKFTPMLTVGFGGDLFAGGSWGLAMLLATHFHLSGEERLPLAWAEVALGIRFGI